MPKVLKVVSPDYLDSRSSMHECLLVYGNRVIGRCVGLVVEAKSGTSQSELVATIRLDNDVQITTDDSSKEVSEIPGEGL